MALVNFDQKLIVVPPLNPALVPAYPFTKFMLRTDDQLLDILHQFIGGHLDENYPIQPVAFTKYSIQQLCAQYHQPPGQFLPLFFFYYWGPHPEKGNKDMSQKCEDDDTIDRCYWKISQPRETLRHGLAFKITYSLYEGSHEAEVDTVRGYTLIEYRWEPEFYCAPLDPPTQKSHWSIVKLIRG